MSSKHSRSPDEPLSQSHDRSGGHGHSRHDHDGGHSHGRHDHGSQGGGHDHGSDRVRLFWTMLLIGSFMVAEVAGGLVSGSLALLSDAGHMLTDFAALALAWYATNLGRKRPDLRRSYGYHRMQVLAAFVNGLALFAICGWIIVEAGLRIAQPVEVLAGPMLVVACVGLVVNIVAFAILHRGHGGESLNIRGATLHVLGDLLGSVAAVTAAVTILYTGWYPADPILSVLVALLILRSAYQLVRESGHILLEGTPENVDPAEVKGGIKAACPEVTDVHHVHIWSLTDTHPVVTLHAVVRDDADPDEALSAINRSLMTMFGIAHSTVQLERVHCPDRPDARPVG